MLSSILLSWVLAVSSPVPQTLDTPFPVWDAIVEDINHDGNPDVLALCKPDDPSIRLKYLFVFMSKGKGLFNSKPDVKFELEPRTGLFMVGDFLVGDHKEILVTTPGGCIFLRFQDGSFVQVGESKFTSLLPTYTLKPRFLRDSVSDMDGDGIDEWVMPVPGGLMIQNTQGFSRFLEGDNTSELMDVGGLTVIHRLPDVHIYDQKDVETKSIALLSERRVDWYEGQAWEEHGDFDIPVQLKENWEARTKLEDVNGDGHPDLMVTQTKGTIDLSTMVQIYLFNASTRYPKKPTFQTTFKGGVTNPTLFDVDKDGDMDLVLINIPFSFKNMANFFLRKKMSVRIDIHFFNGKSFSKKADYKQNFTLDAPDGQERVGYSLGDFSGDGYTDVAISQGRDLISVYTGGKERLLSARPKYQFKLPAFGVLSTQDINVSGGRDLLLFRSVGKDNKRIDVICF